MYGYLKRSTCAIMKVLPAFAATAISSSHSEVFNAIGFSHNTCLPFSKAVSATGLCRCVGRQMSTASMVGSVTTSR